MNSLTNAISDFSLDYYDDKGDDASYDEVTDAFIEKLGNGDVSLDVKPTYGELFYSSVRKEVMSFVAKNSNTKAPTKKAMSSIGLPLGIPDDYESRFIRLGRGVAILLKHARPEHLQLRDDAQSESIQADISALEQERGWRIPLQKYMIQNKIITVQDAIVRLTPPTDSGPQQASFL